MTLDLEKVRIPLPKSAPAGTKGYLIRKRVRQLLDKPPVEEWHVTFDRSPIDIYVPEYDSELDRTNLDANPYKSERLALQAIEMHKSINAVPVTLSEDFYTENMELVTPEQVCRTKEPEQVTPTTVKATRVDQFFIGVAVGLVLALLVMVLFPGQMS